MDDSFAKLIKKEKDPALILKALQTEKKGIAHTYMAEEKLLKGGKELGYDIRIETQGSRGVGTPLTSKEIDEADIVILATDTAVDTSRFDGKKIYAVKVSEAIKNPTEIISQGLKKQLYKIARVLILILKLKQNLNKMLV
ncbi:hypothetical protein FQA39_LY12811 [Lamprigera yunnana]|nr:hypothetical protein FQA39_LY12811 [Lamprigera yunnana]